MSESRSRGVEESEVEAALSALARVEVAPELGEDLRRRITGVPRRQIGWAWAAGVAAMAVIAGGLMRPQRHEDTKGTAERPRSRELRIESRATIEGREPQIAQLTQMAGANGKAKSAAAGAVMRQGTAEPRRDKDTNGTAERQQDPPAAGSQVGNLRGDVRFSETVEDMPALQNDRRPAGVGTPALQGTAGAQADDDLRALQNGGVVLILGRPEPAEVSGSCYIEVTRADGTRTAIEQEVERDAAGRPQMVRLVYDETQAEAALVRQGG